MAEVGIKELLEAGVHFGHQTRRWNRRWLGGLLTNFQTIRKRIQRLHELRELQEGGRLDLLPTKERMSMEAELRKLEYNLGGVADLQRLPDAVVIIDLKTEEIGLREADRLEIPIVGLVDTNCDPTPVDYVIPGNDDAIRSCELVIGTLGESIEGAAAKWREEEARRRAEEEERKRREEEERKRREAEEKAKQEAEEKAKQEAEEKARAEADAKGQAAAKADQVGGEGQAPAEAPKPQPTEQSEPTPEPAQTQSGGDS